MKLVLSPNYRHSLRVVVAAIISIIIGHVFLIPKPYWITVSALVILQPNIGATFLRAKQRSASTLIGVLVGAMVAILIHKLYWLTAMIGLICLFFGVYFSVKDNLKAIFFFSLLIMIILGLFADNIWQFVFYRFFDTVLGVAIGFGLSLILWPMSAKTLLQKDFVELTKNYRQLANIILEQFLSFGINGQVSVGRLRVEIYGHLKSAKQHFEEIQHELDLLSIKRATAFAIIAVFEKIRTTLFAINSVSNLKEALAADMVAYLQELKVTIDKLLGQYEFLLGQDNLTTTIGLSFVPSSRLPPFPAINQSLELSFLQHNIIHLENELNHLYHACRRFLLPMNKEALRIV